MSGLFGGGGHVKQTPYLSSNDKAKEAYRGQTAVISDRGGQKRTNMVKEGQRDTIVKEGLGGTGPEWAKDVRDLQNPQPPPMPPLPEWMTTVENAKNPQPPPMPPLPEWMQTVENAKTPRLPRRKTIAGYG